MRLEAQQDQCPDKWMLVRIKLPDETLYKVLSGWGGSYLYGGSWRMSSPISKASATDDGFEVGTESGSTYILRKTSVGVTGESAIILNQLLNKDNQQNNEYEAKAFNTYASAAKELSKL